MLMGLGQNCPSLDQLEGVVNLADPCQASSPSTPGSSTYGTCPAGTEAAFVQGGSGFTCNPVPTTASTACPAGSTCSYINGVPNTTIYMAVGALAGVMLLATTFRGRR